MQCTSTRNVVVNNTVVGGCESSNDSEGISGNNIYIKKKPYTFTMICFIMMVESTGYGDVMHSLHSYSNILLLHLC